DARAGTRDACAPRTGSRSRAFWIFFFLAALPLAHAATPHLQKRGSATQLIVDGQPFLVRGGELGNSSAEPQYLQPYWEKLRALNVNTVLAPVYWDVIEPEEGEFDFSTVDGLIAGARSNDMRLVLLWFGSWKNSMSCYAPAWVKRDYERFPRARDSAGRPLEILTPFSNTNRDTDARAFAALMRHLRETDGAQHTVIMVQVENEIGMIPEARDRHPDADAAFAGSVPAEMMRYLQEHRDALAPELRERWIAHGAKMNGTWTEVFGESPATSELFMAWAFGRYVEAAAAAGRAEHALPLYVNAALIRPGYLPGQYPSAGPLPPIPKIWEQMHLAWRHGADRIWIVSVGDLKPMEIPIEFFLTYAWNPERWPAARLGEFLRLWAEREFGPEHGAEIADIVAQYTKYNSRRKPEMLEPRTYSLVNYRETERVVAGYRALAERAAEIHAALPAAARDAFFQLVLFPVQACANLNDLYVTAGLNRMHAVQGRASTNASFQRVRELFARDAELTRAYHGLGGGRSWLIIPDHGRTLSGVTPLPVTETVEAFSPDGMRLEYRMYLFSTGTLDVRATLAPTQKFQPGPGFRYGISFGDEEPTIVNIHADTSLRAWERSVADGAAVHTSQHTITKPGWHVLKFWVLDPGLVLQKIVVDTGGARPSCLGPPESGSSK
ncbi:MAG: glycosyl hydrolase 115 family protein, partial [Opitutaceae bacterium]